MGGNDLCHRYCIYSRAQWWYLRYNRYCFQENINAVLINEGLPLGERLRKLNQIAIQQMRVLNGDDNRKLLK